MAIYDTDGTTKYEIGKLYDNNGTTSYQIGKVYDSNGTVVSLIYTAEYVYFPSAEVCDINNWTIKSGGKFELTDTYMWFWGNSDGTYKQCNVTVDFSKYQKMCITISGMNEGYRHSQFELEWRLPGSGKLIYMLDVDKLEDSEQIKTHYIDISNINDICLLKVDLQHGGGGTVTKIWFEE